MLFDSVVTQTTVLENGAIETRDVRLDNGYRGFADTARLQECELCSTAAETASLGSRRKRWQPLLIRNPWADNPLTERLPAPARLCRGR